MAASYCSPVSLSIGLRCTRLKGAPFDASPRLLDELGELDKLGELDPERERQISRVSNFSVLQKDAIMQDERESLGWRIDLKEERVETICGWKQLEDIN